MIETNDIARDLGLPSVRQDWGLLYADPARLGAFVRYALYHFPEVHKGARGDMLDLVFASVEQMELEDGLSDNFRSDLKQLVQLAHGEQDVLRYWNDHLAGIVPTPAVNELRRILCGEAARDKRSER
jgi:hypothetical protein